MAHVFTQMNVQVVFAVYRRENLLHEQFRPELFRYIQGILKNFDQFPLAVNGYNDHIHIFFELAPASNVTGVIQKVKANSSRWINQRRLVPGRFQWQRGYGSFTYSRSQRDRVINYIKNQQAHHQKQPFRKEYKRLLDAFEIQYDKKDLFEFYY
jgi:REP element-mobilizing transposase RayT